MENGKVLITGGCGFIGRHLRRKLVEMGKNVAVLDTSVPWMGYANGYKIVEGDIRDSALVGRWMERTETVYHLAAVTEFDECRDNPLKALDVNAQGTATVLQKAIQHGVGNIVYFSSASVYSGNREPVKHEGMTLDPQSIYGITKLMGERLCEEAEEKYGLTCASLRLLNVYGEGGRGVINKFAAAVRGDKHITIYGDGSQVRDYIHVDDVVKAVIAIGEGRLPGAYNIGTGEGHDVLELREMIEKISGVSFTVERQPKRSWDMPELIADTGKIREILPTTIPLEKGLVALLKENRMNRA